MLSRFAFLLAAAAFAAASTLHASPLDLDPFTLDPGYNGGAIRLDRFGGNNGTHRDSAGQKVVRLADGSYVVAALVDAFDAESGTITGIHNIGVMRLDSQGRKIAWPNVNSGYTDASRNYIVVPNRLNARYNAIADLQVYGNRIYVMADHFEDAAHTDVHVLAFGLDGSYHGMMGLLADEQEHGVGLVFAELAPGAPRMLLVTSHTSSTGFSTLRLARYLIDPVTEDTELDTAFGVNGYLLRAVLDCRSASGTAGACSTLPFAVTTIGAKDDGTPRADPYIFIAGRYLQRDDTTTSSLKQRSFVLKTDIRGGFSFQYGEPNLAGSIDGVVGYDLPNTSAANQVRDIAVRYEAGEGLVAFVLHNVSRGCGAGFNIARIDGAGLGVAAASTTPFGGSDADPCTEQARVTAEAKALILQHDRLAIVGSQAYYFWGILPVQDAWLAIVDANHGYLTEYRMFQAKVGDDVTRGSFNDIALNGDRCLIAAGNATDIGRNERDIASVAGLCADRIFAGSFGSERYDE